MNYKIFDTIIYSEYLDYDFYKILFNNIFIFLKLIYLVSIFCYEYSSYSLTNFSNKYIFNLPYVNRIEFIKRFTKRLENINIVYLKIFQSLCIDKKYLNNEENEYLLKYTDSVPFKNEDVDYTALYKFEKEYNITIDTTKQINSGIISLVFNADYNSNKVVVKVLKKNIVLRINEVFDELLFLSNLISYIPYLCEYNLDKILASNKEILLNQIDFIKECNNIEIFSEKIKNNNEYKIPKVYKSITEKYNNIIVMENIRGLTFDDIKDYAIDVKDKFGYLLYKFGLLSLLYHSAIHCDIHPGNIFFYINDNSELPKYQIGLIDFGIVMFPSKENQDGYYKFFYEVQLNKNFTNIEKIIYTIINEKHIYDALNNHEKQQLQEKIKLCINKHSFNELDIRFFYSLSTIFNSYEIHFTKEFNQFCLSLQVVNNLGKSLSIDIAKTQEKILNEFNSINSLIEI